MTQFTPIGFLNPWAAETGQSTCDMSEYFSTIINFEICKNLSPKNTLQSKIKIVPRVYLRVKHFYFYFSCHAGHDDDAVTKQLNICVHLTVVQNFTTKNVFFKYIQKIYIKSNYLLFFYYLILEIDNGSAPS